MKSTINIIKTQTLESTLTLVYIFKICTLQLKIINALYVWEDYKRVDVDKGDTDVAAIQRCPTCDAFRRFDLTHLKTVRWQPIGGIIR